MTLDPPWSPPRALFAARSVTNIPAPDGRHRRSLRAVDITPALNQRSNAGGPAGAVGGCVGSPPQISQLPQMLSPPQDICDSVPLRAANRSGSHGTREERKMRAAPADARGQKGRKRRVRRGRDVSQPFVRESECGGTPRG
ncbi:hypothetical protein KM043_013518 [Ampulex compressa]|nr:hypothetical protein KM043_013518 [Ampulex compressa]